MATCVPADTRETSYRQYLDALLGEGLLIASGVPGVYGLSGVFENVIEQFERYVTRMGAHACPEVMRFPPLLSRDSYQQTDHLETFPQLMGSVHSFMGTEEESLALAAKKADGRDWSADLKPTGVMMTPAACYPLYPTARGVLPPGGRIVDLRAFVFRHEPSPDPARMQIFRQREYVRLGTPQQALEHRDFWLTRGLDMLHAVGLPAEPVVANDPFFGRGGRVMVASQREQTLKFELVVPVASADAPTAVVSCNYHLDHFGRAFGITTPDGAYAHSACIGFGLERIALALFKTHGFDPLTWPKPVRDVLSPC
jgi:seryl-tRNA synthetase